MMYVYSSHFSQLTTVNKISVTALLELMHSHFLFSFLLFVSSEMTMGKIVETTNRYRLHPVH